MQRTVEPIAAAVARKHASRSVPAVRSRCKSDDKQPRIGIAETRNRFSPIFPIFESCNFVSRYLLPPANEARAMVAGDNIGLELMNMQCEWLFMRKYAEQKEELQV